MRNFSLVFLFLLFSSPGFAQQKCDTLILDVPADTFQMMLEKHDGVLIDVRTKEELDAGYIKGAINIDYRSPDFQTKILALDKTKTYYVYCEVGGQKRDGCRIHEVAGFLQGGYFETWNSSLDRSRVSCSCS